MPSNFIILFEEKEGSTPLVRLLANFDSISVLHLHDMQGWEPFDQHNCGPIPLSRLRRCLDLFYGQQTEDSQKELAELYRPLGRCALEPWSTQGVRGFKMRLVPQQQGPKWSSAIRRLRFKRTVIDRLRAHRVTVFVMFRQDVLRWALSKYHGDGSGKPGHLQFDVAAERVTRDAIPTIRIEAERLERLILGCEQTLAEKRDLINRWRSTGIDTHALLYEEFCDERHGFFADLLGKLGLEVSDADIDAVLAKGSPMRKVHSSDIHEFVDNADEVLERFGQRFVTF